MTTRYRLIHRGSRGGMFYSVDKTTGKRSSLETNDKAEALRKIAAMNEAVQQTAMNLSLARIHDIQFALGSVGTVSKLTAGNGRLFRRRGERALTFQNCHRPSCTDGGAELLLRKKYRQLD